jgi:hypothetical protein
MIKSTKLPLGTNVNKINIVNSPETQHELTSDAFDRGFPFQESSSVTKILTNFEEFDINDENESPINSPPGCNGQLETNNYEVASLKAELDATRRRLAEYETRSIDIPQTSNPLKHNSANKTVFPSSTPSLDYVHRDNLTSCDYDSSFMEIHTPPPPPPHPSPLDFPASVPPLRLPSTVAPFQANPLPNIGSGIIISCY